MHSSQRQSTLQKKSNACRNSNTLCERCIVVIREEATAKNKRESKATILDNESETCSSSDESEFVDDGSSSVEEAESSLSESDTSSQSVNSAVEDTDEDSQDWISNDEFTDEKTAYSPSECATDSSEACADAWSLGTCSYDEESDRSTAGDADLSSGL